MIFLGDLSRILAPEGRDMFVTIKILLKIHKQKARATIWSQDNNNMHLLRVNKPILTLS